MSNKKAEINWPKAFRDAVIILVIGWVIFSVSSCTAKTEQAKFHFMENSKGVTIW